MRRGMSRKIFSNNMPFEPVEVTRGGVPLESAPLIEDILDRELARALYDSPIIEEQFDELGVEPIQFGGREYGITLPMILVVPVKELSRVVVDKETGKKLGVLGAANMKSKFQSIMKHELGY
jgi:hypothetical protein